LGSGTDGHEKPGDFDERRHHNVVVLVDIQAALVATGCTTGGDDGVRVLQQRPGRMVARADTAAGPVVVKACAEAGAFVGEVAAIGRLATHGLPVASILGHAGGPPSYLVLSWIDGEPLTSESPLRAQRVFGELLRRVHAVDGERDPFPDNTTWDAWMAGWLNSALTWWAAVDSPGQERVREAWEWFHGLAPLLATRGQDLMLFDGRPEHILVRGEDVAGLIDVAELRTGDGAMDLGVLAVTDPALLAGVLEGYRPNRDEREAFAHLVPFYAFLRAISYAEWHQRFGTEDELTQALHRIASMEIGAVWQNLAVTGIQPELWVDRASQAVAFYVAAFGATVQHRVGVGDDIVAQLAVDDASFWVAGAGSDLGRFTPTAIGGATSRTLLVVDDPDAFMRRAVEAGAAEASPVADEHGWRIGRIIDPFGHEWEIGKPTGQWPPR
jgi:uncharacterized glyoxalase superfamily protein PhnB/aminoglycoside phosphotransferase